MLINIKILLADDHKIVRDGLRTLIEKEPGMEVIAAAENGVDAVALAKQFSPDVVIMDISMPDMNGIDATRLILKEAPSLKVIALSMYSDRLFVSGMLEAGASGYLLKDCAFEELVVAVRSVVAGKIYLSPKIAGVVVDKKTGKPCLPRSAGSACLTRREREVFRELAEDLSVREIASKLGISPKTVEAHRRNIMEKLCISSVSELIKYAIREGIITV